MEDDVPRIFSDSDRDVIRQKLIDAGRSHFLRYGLRRTNVEELARAAGIAKGTFYNFFDSKEDLCLSIYDQEEAVMRTETAAILDSHRNPEDAIRALLRFALEFIRNDSLLNHLRESGEISLLARGVGAERLASHLDEDTLFSKQVIDSLRAKGAVIHLSNEVAAGVLRAFVMLSLHQDEIGRQVYSEVVETLMGWIATGFAGNHPREED